MKDISNFEKMLISITGFAYGSHKRCITTQDYSMSKRERLMSRLVMTLVFGGLMGAVCLALIDAIHQHGFLSFISLLWICTLLMLPITIFLSLKEIKKTEILISSKIKSFDNLTPEEHEKREFMFMDGNYKD